MRILILLLALLFPFHARAENTSTYDRVTQTKTLRCGYMPYEPFIKKDPNTGKLSGITVDYLNATAEKEGIKIDWTTEIAFDQLVPAFESGKIDAFCMPCTPLPSFEKVMGFHGSLGALPYYVYVPQNSTLTEESLKTASFAVMDGYALTGITKKVFPQGKYLSLPQTSSTAELYDQLRYGKAEAHVNEHISATNYMRGNPDLLRRFSDKPVIAMRMFLITPKSDEKMAAFVDKTFDAAAPENAALLESLKQKYNVSSDALLLGDSCTPAISEEGWRICAK